MDANKLIEMLLSSLVTLGAAYAGARYAFKFSQNHQADILRAAQIEECNRAMHVLARQFNFLLVYRKQNLEAYKTHPGRHFVVSASPELGLPHSTINTPALAFLLATDARELPMMMAIADERFQSTLQLINLRSRLHIEQYQPAMEVASKEHGEAIPGNVVEAAVGPRITISLRRLTDEVYESVDSAISSLGAGGKSMQAVLKTVYPDAKIIGFTFPIEGVSLTSPEAGDQLNN